jgi:ubiquinone/menaquinone biosynthesis C-methylase UbiE
LEKQESKSRVENYYNLKYYGRPRKFKVERKRLPPFIYYSKCLDILDVQSGRRILDIACGFGGLLLQAENRGLECYGIDISQVAISKAEKRTKAQLVCKSVEDGLPYDDAFFDYITCLGSLEHFHKQPFVIQEISRISKEECKICILVPNDNYILHKFGYETDFQPVVNRHSLEGYQTLLESNGLTIRKVLKENAHLMNLRRSSSYFKHFVKLIVYPFVRFLPLNWSYNFIFLCGKRI